MDGLGDANLGRCSCVLTPLMLLLLLLRLLPGRRGMRA